ncbi:MAG: hypothetical protein V4801_05160 [Burkholderia gladioli]|nr:hypothetical protein [Burkholderia sp. ISTR5]
MLDIAGTESLLESSARDAADRATKRARPVGIAARGAPAGRVAGHFDHPLPIPENACRARHPGLPLRAIIFHFFIFFSPDHDDRQKACLQMPIDHLSCGSAR